MNNHPERILEIADRIDGWMDVRELAWVQRTVSAIPDSGVWIEVGVWKGRSLVAACLSSRCKVFGVDHFRGSPEHNIVPCDLFAECITNLRAAGAFPYILVASSREACDLFADGSVEGVFIDASHERAAVVDDINLWLPKVRAGGLLCGHDYGQPAWPGVALAVDETLPGACRAEGTIWTWQKPATAILDETGLAQER